MNISALEISSTMAMGAFGAVSVNLLQLLELKNIPKAERPDLKDFFYWFPFFVWPMMGGGLAYAHEASGNTLSPLLAYNLGVSAPLIIRGMAEANPFDKPTSSSDIS